MHTTRSDPSSSASYYAPLLRFLEHQPSTARVEIPFTRDHWEAVFVASHAPLARGWERQLDMTYNSLFYERRPLSAEAYHRWLVDSGVTWVALPDVPLDYSARAEARLLNGGLSYLQPVWHDAHWRLWRVEGSPSLATGSAQLVSVRPDGFVLDATAPGTTTVRLRYTSAWSVIGGAGCVRETSSHWTQVVARAPGRITVSASLTPAHTDCDAP